MNNLLTSVFKNLTLIGLCIFANLTSANNITADYANIYPYKDLIDRTHIIKVFYTTNGESYHCKVEVVLGQMKWVTQEQETSKELFYKDPLLSCLPKENAKQLLFQTFLEFGRGL